MISNRKMEAIKTDLRLLLECLKYQMKLPAAQKQALLTILSICKHNGQYVEFFIEIGGISFIYNLSKSCSYSEVKQTALFTLASLAELYESCKQTLCREDTFRDLAQRLEQEMPLTYKRVAVYMLGVLVANNRCGQTFAKTSRCIEILLNLFRNSFPEQNESYEQTQFWAAVFSALCGSVNNPQNEENQNACTCAFTLVIKWLQEVTLPRAELAQPICSFIGMTVANNSGAQEYFVSVGGLDSLSNTLTRVLPQSAHSAAACKMATVITKTLSACISSNELLMPCLSSLRVVPGLLSLLSSPNLDPQGQLAVMVTIGQLTDASVEHQSQLVSSGGLTLMISLLTEATDEEVKRAAMFVLYTCKRITETLCGSMSVKLGVECDMERHWQSAAVILQRIQQLEKKLEKDNESQHSGEESGSSVINDGEWFEGSVIRKVRDHHLQACEVLCRPSAGNPDQPTTNPRTYNQESMQGVRKHGSSAEYLGPSQITIFRHSNCKKEIMEEQTTEPESLFQMTEMSNDRETEMYVKKSKLKSETVVNRLKMIEALTKPTLEGDKPSQSCNTPTRGDRDTKGPDIFKHPDLWKRGQRTQTLSDDEISLCSELLDKEIKRFLKPPFTSKSNILRCAGCVKLMHEVDSRSFGAAMRGCRYHCDFHQVLQKAEDHYRKSQQLERASYTPARAHINTHREETKSREWDRCLSLTPLRRQCEKWGSNIEEKLVKRKLETSFDNCSQKSTSGRRRDRKNWSAEELHYLSKGVKRFGHSWNTILWKYPFQKGRTNVDLAKKYQRMQKAKAQGLDLS
ncbi:telomere repeats-binding bouquet formation protein 1 isoform X2 [Triplophysa dalaica]|uniref:telomere repeats-binding bouquet formation protein 1 isoform X2 n=2 Tax=Triplophysa dalaica TaxID=1582913 RepID=UPI0024DFA944|nr:telomere repeats-binding bouquet formation protein 1 isoform X2 [Triplophysa dalaica]